MDVPKNQKAENIHFFIKLFHHYLLCHYVTMIALQSKLEEMEPEMERARDKLRDTERNVGACSAWQYNSVLLLPLLL